MKTIRVTGTLDISDDEYDPGPLGPLTEQAYNQIGSRLGLDDVEFSLEDDS